MAAEVGALRVAVGADISGLKEGMAKAQAAVSNGVATMSKSAKASARIFQEGRVSAEQLLGAVDPLFAAQLRYDKELAKAQQLMKAGSLTAAEFTKVQAGLKAQLDQTHAAFGKVGGVAGSTRSGMQQLSFQMGDVAQGFALGVKPMTIFAQQGGQIIQSLQLMGGGANKFLNLLAGPWGLALSVATSLIVLFAARHKDASQSVEDLVDKLRKQASEAEAQQRANEIWAKSIDGVREAQEKLHKELEGSLRTEGVLRQQNLDAARAGFETQRKELAAREAELRDLEKKRPGLFAQTESAGSSPSDTEAARAQLARLDARVAELRKNTAQLRADIQKSEANVRDAQLVIANSSADASASATKAISDQADALKGAVNAGVEAGKVSVDAAEKARIALNKYTEAQQAAAAQGVKFAKIGASQEISELSRGFVRGRVDVASYTKAIEQATAALNKAAAAAKEANKHKLDPASQFKQSVIGAEGTGQNPQSSAVGFGQFIRTTWLSYFNRLFPDKATLTDDAKLAFRNVRTVAEAVIDKATEDYSKVLKSAGQQITAAGLYTVHVLGPAGAAKFLKAPGTASTASVVGAGVVSKNKSLLGGTVADARAEIARRIGDSSGSVSSGAAAIEHALQQGLEQERKNRQRFFDDEQQVFAQIIEARKDQGLSAAEIAKFEHDAVEASRQKLEVDILGKQAAGEYTQAEVDLRISLNNELAKLRDQTVERRKAQAEYAERERQIENASRVVSGLASVQSELLKAREGLVTTARGRREIEERLLDLQFEEEKRLLEAQIQEAARLRALADRTKATQDIAAAERAEADAAIARARLGTLPERQEIAQEQNDRSNASPIEQWKQTVPQTAEQITEAFQKIQVEGLERLSDALADVILGTKSLKEAAHEMAASFIADTIRMITRMLLLKAITAAFGGGTAPVGDVTSSGIYPDFNFANGGSFTIGGRGGIDKNIMSINGLPIANVSKGERVNISNDNSESMGMGPMSLTFHNDFRGADQSAVAAIQARLDRMQAELPATIIGTVQDGKQRFYLR